MPEMPERPPGHVLEDASELALRRGIPPEWVYRRQPSDYGIDGELEVFDQGLATGLICKVQLKGTDQELAPGGMLIRFTHKQRAYFASLGVPVLVAVYHRPADRLFVRWVRSFDPAFDSLSDKSWAMRFTEDHEWRKQTPDRLADDLKLFYALENPSLLPVTLALVATTDSVMGVEIHEVTLRLRQALRPFSKIVGLAPREDESAVVARLTPGQTTVAFSAFASASVHYVQPWEGDAAPVRAVADIISSLGFILVRTGHLESGASLLRTFAISSSYVQNLDALPAVAGALAHAGHMAEAIAFVEAAEQALPDQVTEVRLTGMMTWSSLRRDMTPHHMELVAGHLERAATADERHRGSKAAAGSRYTHANWLHSVGRHREALHSYAKAAELDPSYGDREYFHGEIGGSLFQSGQFRQAADSYRRAFALGSSNHVRLLMADALLHTGDYASALSEFHAAAAGTALHAEWRLKTDLLEYVVANGPQSQERQPEHAVEKVLQLGEDLAITDEAAEATIAEAQSLDRVCAPAWYSLGALRLRQGRLEEAGDAFVASAVLALGEGEPWALAVVLAAMTGNERVAQLAVECAVRYCGETFVEELIALCSRMEDPTWRAYVVELADEVATYVGADTPGLKVRLATPEGRMEEFEIRFDPGGSEE